MICPIHNKPLKVGQFGLFCPTPIERSPDGKVVTKWCSYKPGQPELVSETIQPKTSLEGKPEYFPEDIDGKIRHGLACAVIQHDGLQALTDDMKETMRAWVEFIKNDK